MRALAKAESRPRQRAGELARASEALADLAQTLAPVDVEVFMPLEDSLSDWRTPRTAGDLGPRFPALLRAAERPLGRDPERNAFNRALVAHLASRLRLRLYARRLPTDVVERVPPALERLRAFLSEPRDGYELGDDYFLKDVRFAAGMDGSLRLGGDRSSGSCQPAGQLPDCAQSQGTPTRPATPARVGAGPLVRAAHRVATSRRVQRGRLGDDLPERRLTAAQAHRCRGGRRLQLVLRPRRSR